MFVVDTVNYERLEIQWVPKELDYNPESDFVAISSPGRNNSFFHFGGSDDTLTLELDWSATEENRQDVIRKCRWLESKSKNTDSEEGVHPVILHFGDANKLFSNRDNQSTWLVVSAKYTLTQFSRPHAMMPTQAIQQLVLKRITENQRTHDEIKFVEPPPLYTPPNEDPDYLGRQFHNSLKIPKSGLVLIIKSYLKLFSSSNRCLRLSTL